jgi:hypothetical protein
MKIPIYRRPDPIFHYRDYLKESFWYSGGPFKEEGEIRCLEEGKP